MRSLVVLCFVAMVLSVPVAAQIVDAKAVSDDLQKVKDIAADSLPWKLKASLGAGLTQVSLTNWSGGGQNTVTIRGLALASADYADGAFSWDNDADLGYSLTKLGSQEFRKNDDRIILTSKASMKQTEGLRYTALLDFRTQFAVGYNFDQQNADSTNFLVISNLLSPAYLTAAVGAEWTPYPQLRMLISPLSSRSIFVLDDELSAVGAYGVDPGRNIKTDVGALLNATIDWEIVENVQWKSRFNAFCRYDAPDLWIVTVENAFLMKVNSFLNVGLLTDLFYDDRVPVIRDDGSRGPATQIRNQLVVNFVYNISNH
jgi:hypothetical protein